MLVLNGDIFLLLFYWSTKQSYEDPQKSHEQSVISNVSITMTVIT